MAKIGRNEKCPCGSGKKYKRCCGLNPTIARKQVPGKSPQVTLTYHIEQIQKAAVEKRQHLIEVGVFILFSTSFGDSWLLELTDSDCIQLAEKGTIIDPEIKEDPEVIEVNWTHTFAMENKQLEVTTYKGGEKQILIDYPTRELAASIRRIMKKFSASQLESVHLDPHSVDDAE